MKTAIPAYDGLTFTPGTGQASGFPVPALELGEVTQEERNWNKPGETFGFADGVVNPINDFRSVPMNNISSELMKMVAGQNKGIIRSGESIITNAYVHYPVNNLRKEANTCCHP